MCRDQISFRQRTRLDNDEEFNLLEEIDRVRRVLQEVGACRVGEPVLMHLFLCPCFFARAASLRPCR